MSEIGWPSPCNDSGWHPTADAVAAEALLPWLGRDATQPLLLLAADARVLWSNAAARAVLARQPCLVLADGVLLPRREEEALAFTATLSALTPRGRAALSLCSRQQVPVLTLVLHGLREGISVVRLAEAGVVEPPDAGLVAQAFGLTPAEARVAALLATGADVAAMAKILGLRAATVRSHLKGAMRKTECRTQARLALLVVRGVG